MYTRASASDYDDWQAPGWSTKELIPLMKKHETYQRSCLNPEVHGFEGPIKVSFGNYCYRKPKIQHPGVILDHAMLLLVLSRTSLRFLIRLTYLLSNSYYARLPSSC